MDGVRIEAAVGVQYFAKKIAGDAVEQWCDLHNHYIVEMRTRRERGGGFHVEVDTATDPDGDFGYTESTVVGHNVPSWLLAQALGLIGLTVMEVARTDVYCSHKDLWNINPAYTGKEA